MTTQVVFKINPAVKREAMRRAKREGVPFASVLKLVTKAYAEGAISIGIEVKERFNKKNSREIRAALRDIEQGKNLIKFKSSQEADDYLLSL
jgi:antitoxin component of RelBE/YafQ-DinJ toxin-antitoxin module